MNTSTVIAVALAIIVALGFLFYGPSLVAFFGGNQATATQSSGATSAPTTVATSTAAGSASDKLQITDDVVGTGATAQTGDTVSVDYTGMLADGTVFDSTQAHGGRPFSFTLGGQVIAGWNDGVVGMKVGGTRTLVIPPSLGYGSQPITNPQTGQTIIPANSTLTFKIKLLSVTPPAK